jgi:CheY-like chemotaxis protein
MPNSGRVIRVLLIEDNPGDQLLVREAFATCPVQIDLRCVDNGEDALSVLSDPGYKPDLIIVDLNIPRIDGAQVTRFVKREASLLRTVPAILFSSLPYEDAAARSLTPADAFFTKPASLDDYFAIIREICRLWLEPLIGL